MSLSTLFTDIANAIRNKKGTTDPIVASNFPSEIESIETGGGAKKYTYSLSYSSIDNWEGYLSVDGAPFIQKGDYFSSTGQANAIAVWSIGRIQGYTISPETGANGALIRDGASGEPSVLFITLLEDNVEISITGQS